MLEVYKSSKRRESKFEMISFQESIKIQFSAKRCFSHLSRRRWKSIAALIYHTLMIAMKASMMMICQSYKQKLALIR